MRMKKKNLLWNLCLIFLQLTSHNSLIGHMSYSTWATTSAINLFVMNLKDRRSSLFTGDLSSDNEQSNSCP